MKRSNAEVDDSLFRLAAEASPLAIFVSVHRQFQYVNPAALALWGAEDDEQIVGAEVFDRIDPEFHPAIKQRLVDVLEKRIAAGAAFERFVRLDGTRIEVETTAVPILWKGDPGALVFSRDRTMELSSQGLIRTQQRLLGLMGKMAKIGGWQFDPATGEGQWTEETARIHDLDPNLPTNTSLGLGFYPPEDRAKLDVALTRAIENGVGFDLTLNFVSAVGAKKRVRTRGSPYWEGGKLVRIEGIFQDVTEAWTSVNALEDERERLAATLRSIREGVFTVDDRGRIIDFSRSAEDLTGWPQADARGQNWTTVAPLVDEWTGQAVNLRDGKEQTALLNRRDGKSRLVRVSLNPILGEQSELRGSVVVLRDQSDQQRIAEMVQRSQTLESIGLLAGGIAHDFNNLMSGLFGQVQLALDRVRQGQNSDAENNLERALGVFSRAKDLTTQLLAFSKGGAPVRTPCDLDPLIRRTVQFALAGSNVRAEFALEPLATILADPNQLAQAIDNLVINARQAMPTGGKVRIEARMLEEKKQIWAQITVSDTGPGMKPEVLTRIFDPFFTTKAGGHGLGLAAVRTILERHKGRVRVESTPGQGTRFFLELPAGELLGSARSGGSVSS